MASYVTPKKNTAFVFYVSLEDQANPGLFKSNPTLAAGDVKVAVDDAAPANPATLPAVDADFQKRVKVSLSADEMNGDNITLIFSDAAGDEWYDLEINIQTTARQIDDLAFPATSGRGLTVAATGEASANVTMWKGSTAPAMTGDAYARLGAPAGASVSADIAALPTASEIDTELSGTHGSGAWGNASGSGTGTYTDTILDVGDDPLDGVRVQLSTDSAGSNRVYEAYTNASGVFEMSPDPGTYYRWLDLAGYTFDQGVEVEVT